jgi:phosphoglycolate phosphatase
LKRNFDPKARHLEELEKIRLAVFDLDGTLIDSARQIVLAVNRTREGLQLSNVEKELLKSKIGLPAKELFSDLSLSRTESDTAVKSFRTHLRAIRLEPSDAFSKSFELLDFLKVKGMKLAIATNKPTDLAKIALKETELLPFFDLVVGGEKLSPKPNPATVAKCLLHLNQAPSRAVMIGDRLEDMLAASAVNVSAYGVLQGIHNEVELRNAGAKQIFLSISHLFRKLKEGWNFENI